MQNIFGNDPQVKTGAVQLDIGVLRQALATNHELFIQFHLAEELSFPIPEFHLVSFGLMLASTVSQIALALPRGHAKTTLAKLAVVHYLWFTSYRFIVYVSNTATVAQAAVRDIVGFLTSANSFAVFGEVKFEIDRPGEGFYQFMLNGKRRILMALGAGQQVRGLNIDNLRPELGVVDDLESDENTMTEALRIKLKNWVYGSFFKAFNVLKRKIIWLGNMLSNDSLLHHFCLSDAWYSMRYGAIKNDGTPLWPDLWPVHKLREDYQEYCKLGLRARWFAEMMNMPMPSGQALIDVDLIRYAPALHPADVKHVFITIDPAISKKEWADKTAIVVHAYMEETNHWQIVEFVRETLDPLQTYRVCLELCRKWRCAVVGIESIAYQSSLHFFFEYQMALDAETTVKVFKLFSGSQKPARLAAWCAWLKDGTYQLTEGDLVITEQLMNFDPVREKNDDDVIDSCAYGIQMIQNYIGDIMTKHGIMQGSMPSAMLTHQVSAH